MQRGTLLLFEPLCGYYSVLSCPFVLCPIPFYNVLSHSTMSYPFVPYHNPSITQSLFKPNCFSSLSFFTHARTSYSRSQDIPRHNIIYHRIPLPSTHTYPRTITTIVIQTSMPLISISITGQSGAEVMRERDGV